jgi:phosphatidylinositol alpha-1,6-mannosyltransferase
MTSQHTATGDFEGFGIAVVEAALCGKPAVVSGNSGLEEAVVDGETAFVVPQSDPVATAGALMSLLADEPLRIRFGKAARQRAMAEQTWAARAAAYDQLLRTVNEDSPGIDGLRWDGEVPR